MADISSAVEPAWIKRIYAHYERKNETGWRGHRLGPSQAGRPCDREIWYNFRECRAPDWSGRMLRLFDTGAREESRFIADLRNAGLEVYDRDPVTKKQFSVTLGSVHVGGSMDGVGRGFDEAPNKWHVLEFKTHSEKSFSLLKKKGLQEAKPEHWTQCQLYMLAMNRECPGEFDRAVYLAKNKNTDELWGCRVYLDHMAAEKIEARCLSIVNSPRPPAGIGSGPDDFRCRFCSFRDMCYESAPALRGCRNCLHSTPATSGWVCEDFLCGRWDNGEACERHRYIPEVAGLGAVVDASPGGEWVKYERGVDEGF